MRMVMVCLVVGCSASEPVPPDVVGPFTGELRRYVVDGLLLPKDRHDFAADLDGTGPANQLGSVVAALASNENAPPSLGDLIASGVLSSVVTLQADDLSEDPQVGVRFEGQEGEGGDFAGGVLHAGRFLSNRTRTTTHPASMTAHLPVFLDADPLVVPLVGVQIDLVPDGDGYLGQLNGAVPIELLIDLTATGLLQMVAHDPYSHPYLFANFDTDGDGSISREEVANHVLVKNLTVPGVNLFDAAGNWHPEPSTEGRDAFSVGFAFHLSPCASGRCSTSVPQDLCHDRVLDGDESAVDCGGGSQTCTFCVDGIACKLDHDCRSGLCDHGVCAPTACSNRKHDPNEGAVDCGGPCPKLCLPYQACNVDSDCLHGNCLSGTQEKFCGP